MSSHAHWTTGHLSRSRVRTRYWVKGRVKVTIRYNMVTVRIAVRVEVYG